MTVYVDDMHKLAMGKLGRMQMCHMISDSDDELHAMAASIGMKRSWWQSPERTSGSHYDVATGMRAKAIAAGAIEITLKQCAMMNGIRRITGKLPAALSLDELYVMYKAARNEALARIEAAKSQPLAEVGSA